MEWSLEPVDEAEDGDVLVPIVALTTDEFAAVRAAVLLAEESLRKALIAVQRYEGADSPLSREVGSALEALATTEDDLRHAGRDLPGGTEL